MFNTPSNTKTEVAPLAVLPPGAGRTNQKANNNENAKHS